MALLPRKVGRSLPDPAFEFAIIAPAIKTHLWQSLHEGLSSSSVKFHMVFCGHVKPDFELPENFTFIFSKKGPVHCAEIARRFSIENVDSKYTMFIADDFTFDSGFLDSAAMQYKKAARDNPGRDVMIAPPHQQGGCGKDYKISGPLVGFPIMTSKISKKLGSIDKRLKGVLWDQDMLFRFYSKNGIMVPIPTSSCPTVKELKHRDQVTPNFLWNRFSVQDQRTMLKIWTNYPHFSLPENVNNEMSKYIKSVYTHFLDGYASDENITIMGYCYEGSSCSFKDFFFKRNDDVAEFTDKDLYG